MEIEYSEGKMIVHYKTTVTAENYFPFQSPYYTPNLNKKVYASAGATSEQYILNQKMDLMSENITIDYFEKIFKYGETELAPPFKEFSPHTFPDINAVGMATSTLTINWNYETNDPTESDSVSIITLVYAEIGVDIYAFSTIAPVFLIISSFFWKVFPYLVFVLAGYVLSWIWFREEYKECNLREAYDYLTKFNPEEETRTSGNLLSKLKILQFFPKKIGIIRRVIFGLSILLFEVSANSWMKKHQDYYALHKKDTLVESFSRYSEDKLAKLSDILPERQLIVIGLGFLASIGISFSWNIGAIAPFLLSLGIFYFFLNLGSSFYLMGNSKTERNLLIALFVLCLFVLNSSFILGLLRSLTFQ